MNIVRFEFKNLFLIIFKWSISIAILTIVYVAFYSVLESQMIDFLKVMPEQLVSVLQLEKLLTFDGYFVYILSYTSLALAIQALWLGMDIFLSEFHTNSIEFLYVKPLSKFKIILYKFLVRFLLLLSTWLSWMLLVNIYLSLFQVNYSIKISILLSISVFISSCLMMAIGMVIGVVFGNIKNSYMVSFVVALFIFVYDMLAHSFNNSMLSKLAMFSYIDKYELISNRAISLSGLLMAILVIVSCATLSLVIFVRKKNYIR